MPAGNAANASSVGAKTVNGPGPLKVSPNPAAVTAATNVPKFPADDATSTMLLTATSSVTSSVASLASLEQADRVSAVIAANEIKTKLRNLLI
jgi:hypothetical protein